jgi:hypothetical protein
MDAVTVELPASTVVALVVRGSASLARRSATLMVASPRLVLGEVGALDPLVCGSLVRSERLADLVGE